ncbi:MAG: hypothetical protein U0Z17_07430 [Bacteroidales bacterium]
MKGNYHPWTEDLVKPVISTTATSHDLGCNPTVVAPVFTLTEACSPGKINVVDGGVQGTGRANRKRWTATFTDACNNMADEKGITTEPILLCLFWLSAETAWTSSIPPVCADALALVDHRWLHQCVRL